jgi:hypothetical protein
MITTKAFLYRWTELSTKKWYIGSRTRKGCHINDRYICSAPTVKKLIVENPSDWVRDILCIGESKYIGELEGKYLKVVDAKRDLMSYNQVNHWPNVGCLGKPSPIKGILSPLKGKTYAEMGRGPSPTKGKPRPGKTKKGIKTGPQKNPSGPTGPQKNPYLGPSHWKGKPSPIKGVKQGPRGKQKNPHQGLGSK